MLSDFSRCCYLLQQGLPVADVCFYYGDDAPNLVATRRIGVRRVFRTRTRGRSAACSERGPQAANGKPLGILWKPPYACDVTGLVRNGKNELKIEITNLWANRLVGDANLPREKRVTRITQKVPIGGPHESGLFGPVQLRY